MPRLKGNLLTKVERTIEIGKNIAKHGMEPEGYQNGAKTEPKRVQMESKGWPKRPKWSPKGAQNEPNGDQGVHPRRFRETGLEKDAPRPERFKHMAPKWHHFGSHEAYFGVIFPMFLKVDF